MPLTLTDAAAAVDASLYLARIGHDQPISLTAECLRALHRAHCFSIPFENLDLHLGVPVRNDFPGVFTKLVTQRRGGYCFEQNGLFAAMLARFGFGVRAAIGRVVMGSDDPRIRGHLMTLVNLGGTVWIADVGFGGYGLIEPLRLTPNEVQVCAGEEWMVSQSHGGFEVNVRRDGDWFPLYWFDLATCYSVDVDLVNHYHQTSSASFFNQNRLIARTKPGERLFLTNDELKTIWAGVTQTRKIASRTEYLAVLDGQFGIRLPQGVPLKQWGSI